MDAIQQICEELDLKPVAKRLSKLVTNDEDLVGDDRVSHVFKLRPTRIDQDAFRHAMDNGLAVDDFEDSLIVQAHEFFRQVRKWLEDGVGSELNSIDALETAVTALLQIVVIDLSPGDDPNVIFETLIARGTPLEQSDLIKNFVLSQSPQKGNGEATFGKGWTICGGGTKSLKAAFTDDG